MLLYIKSVFKLYSNRNYKINRLYNYARVYRNKYNINNFNSSNVIKVPACKWKNRLNKITIVFTNSTDLREHVWFSVYACVNRTCSQECYIFLMLFYFGLTNKKICWPKGGLRILCVIININISEFFKKVSKNYVPLQRFCKKRFA